MKKFTVKFSNQSVVVWAKDHNSAVKKAIEKETEKLKIISDLTICLKDGDPEDEEMLYHFEWLIKNKYIDMKYFQYLN